MSHTDILKYTDEQILEVVRQLRIAYQLKRTLRYSTTRDLDTHNESVAEHVFALFFLAEYFLPLEDPEKKIDIEKLHHIILFHDFGEIPHGDVPYHLKTSTDKDQEHEDALSVFAELPSPLNELARDNWYAYKAQECLEARFARALDKIEPVFELFDPINEQTIKRLKFTYHNHFEYKRKAAEGFPVITTFLEAVTRDMLARNVFWKEE